MAWSRVLAIVSALIATAGLLLYGWSPTTVLALFWVETAVLMLTPWLAILVVSPFAPAERGGRWVGVLVGLLPLVVLGALLAAYAFLILVLGALQPIPAGDGVTIIGAREEDIRAVLDGLVADRQFLVGAVVIAAMTLVELRGSPRTPGASVVPLGRLALLHVVLGSGAVLIATLQLPAAAALLLVAVKLVLDLRRARPAPAAAAHTSTPGAA